VELARVAYLFLIPLIFLGVLGEAGVFVGHAIAWPIVGICIVVGAVLTIASWFRPAKDKGARIIASILYAGLIVYLILPFVLSRPAGVAA
jgi:hypothetical protein